MKYNNSPDVLGLPLTIAKERLHKMGYNIAKVRYTLSPKKQATEASRVVRQNIIKNNNVELILANYPWFYVDE